MQDAVQDDDDDDDIDLGSDRPEYFGLFGPNFKLPSRCSELVHDDLDTNLSLCHVHLPHFYVRPLAHTIDAQHSIALS